MPTFDPTETEDRDHRQERVRQANEEWQADDLNRRQLEPRSEDRGPSLWDKTLEVQGRTHEEFFPQNLAKVIDVAIYDWVGKKTGLACTRHDHYHDTWRKETVDPLE